MVGGGGGGGGGGCEGGARECIIQSLTWLVQLMPLLFHKPFTRRSELSVRRFFFFLWCFPDPHSTTGSFILHSNGPICRTSPELLSSRIPAILESFTDWS